MVCVLCGRDDRPVTPVPELWTAISYVLRHGAPGHHCPRCSLAQDVLGILTETVCAQHAPDHTDIVRVVAASALARQADGTGGIERRVEEFGTAGVTSRRVRPA